MVVSRLDKTERVGPTPLPPAPKRHSPRDDEAIAMEIQSILLDIRLGVATSARLTEDGLKVLERISADGKTRFFHLTDEARTALRSGFCLPWGG